MTAALFAYLLAVNAWAYLMLADDRRRYVDEQPTASDAWLLAPALAGGIFGTALARRRLGYKRAGDRFGRGLRHIVAAQIVLLLALAFAPERAGETGDDLVFDRAPATAAASRT